MIDFYTAPTPNGHKVSCTLEAMELEYETHVVNLMENEQKNLSFLQLVQMAESLPLLIETPIIFQFLSQAPL